MPEPMENATAARLSAADRALVGLLDALAGRGYRFVTPTPATQARVVSRPARRRATGLADVLGWSLPFEKGAIDDEVFALLATAGVLGERDGLIVSRVRVSSVGERLFLHSAYPTEEIDSVFFGPDSYRFADFIRAELPPCLAGGRIVDIGTGAGVGAIVAADTCPGARIVMTDINRQALRFARINAVHAGIEAEFVETNALDGVTDAIDVALANPPYIIDPQGRAYRDGGDMHGARIALDMARAAADRLAPGGRLLLYSGSAIVNGEDALRVALEQAMAERGCDLSYREIDPDVFGEELDGAAYADVERIAVVGAVATKRGGANGAGVA